MTLMLSLFIFIFPFFFSIIHWPRSYMYPEAIPSPHCTSTVLYLYNTREQTR